MEDGGIEGKQSRKVGERGAAERTSLEKIDEASPSKATDRKPGGEKAGVGDGRGENGGEVAGEDNSEAGRTPAGEVGEASEATKTPEDEGWTPAGAVGGGAPGGPVESRRGWVAVEASAICLGGARSCRRADSSCSERARKRLSLNLDFFLPMARTEREDDGGKDDEKTRLQDYSNYRKKRGSTTSKRHTQPTATVTINIKAYITSF